MHGGPAELYRGTGARGLPDMPSPMFRAQVDCIACHKNRKATEADAEIVGQTFTAVQDSCNYCHGTKYPGVLDAWKNEVAVQEKKAEAAYASAKAAFAASSKRLSPTESLKVERLLGDAEHNIRLIRLGHGVHNINYATAALNVAVQRCEEAQKAMAGAMPVAGAGP
jgi:hypothetical protein